MTVKNRRKGTKRNGMPMRMPKMPKMPKGMKPRRGKVGGGY